MKSKSISKSLLYRVRGTKTMPFLRAAQIKRELNFVLVDAKNVGSKDFQEKVKEAVREMKHMNSLLNSSELILSGM